MSLAGGEKGRDPPVVLVVEDDPDIALLIAQCLREVGYQTVLAGDGAEALLAVAKAPKIALILLDWWLPGALWGRPLVQTLREKTGAEVIVISADPAALTEASEAGAADYLPKPFQLADLVHVVDEHCQ